MAWIETKRNQLRTKLELKSIHVLSSWLWCFNLSKPRLIRPRRHHLSGIGVRANGEEAGAGKLSYATSRVCLEQWLVLELGQWVNGWLGVLRVHHANWNVYMTFYGLPKRLITFTGFQCAIFASFDRWLKPFAPITLVHKAVGRGLQSG